jgi:hypothetical protein
MWLELIPTSSLVIVISVVNFIVRKVDNEVLQGVTIVATGLTVLIGATMVFKNREQRGKYRASPRLITSSTRRSGHGA